MAVMPSAASSASRARAALKLPSVVKVGKRLALFYDGLAEDSLSHMRRDIGLAWLQTPLEPPKH